MTIPDEAIEAAAKELAKAAYGDWSEVLEGPRQLFLRDARAALEAALPTHWACMTCSAGTDKPITNRQAEIAAANHASQGGHPTVYAKVKP